MKRIYFILAVLSLLLGCARTKEQRGAKIAKSEIMKYLYNAESHEPIETQTASAFTSIYTDMDVLSAVLDLIELNVDRKKE